MNVIIMRHGEASPYASKDEARQLTARGRSEVIAAVNARRESLALVERLIVSPFVRAQETAELVRGELGVTSMETCADLIPSADPRRLAQYLDQAFSNEQSGPLMLVSHLPLVGDFTDWLCGDVPGTNRFSTATVVSVEFEVVAKGCGCVNWASHTR